MRFEPNDSFFAASCCSVDVVNGADGFLRRSRRLTSVTSKVLRPSRSSRMRSRFGLVVDLGLLAVDVMELGGELLAVLLEQRLDGPVLDRLERANLALALDDEPQRDGLHAAGGESLLHGLPQHRARLVADEAIEHATRLLRLDLLAVDLAGVQDRALHGVLRDLVKEHAPDRACATAPRFGVICVATCAAIASPSRSGSVAISTSLLSFAALFSSAIVFSFPGIGTRSGVKPFSTSMPSFFSGRSMMWPTVARTR